MAEGCAIFAISIVNNSLSSCMCQDVGELLITFDVIFVWGMPIRTSLFQRTVNVLIFQIKFLVRKYDDESVFIRESSDRLSGSV